MATISPFVYAHNNKESGLVNDYIMNCKESSQTPSLKQFIDNNITQIIKTTDFRRNIRECWTRLFIDELEELNIEGEVEKDLDWNVINDHKNKNTQRSLSPSASPHLSTNNRSNSKKSAKIMTVKALKEVENDYCKVLKSENVWKLSSGRIVEKVMLDYALSLKYEHPVHSIILNPDDQSYVDVFTEQELQEIQDLKKILTDLYRTVTAKFFDPLTEGDLYWARKSFEETLDLYHFKFFENDYVEDDVEYRIWPFVSKCFDPTPIRARSGKRKSQASSDRHNRKRTLSSTEPTARHITGVQPDMKCLYLNYEIGFTEVGLKDDGENGTKELYESGMKAPKMLKDFFVSIIHERPSIIHSIKTGAFIISGLHMSSIIMDCPAGSVCRITQSERASFPLAPTVCSTQLIPIIELVYRTRLYLMETVEAIDGCDQVVSLGKKCKKRVLVPPCITSPGSSSSSTTVTTTTTEIEYENQSENGNSSSASGQPNKNTKTIRI
ncbi:hypothetical protein BDA99DRAFT_591785 [Phascolomyces articulosus]|uniref:Uncharacterized protein n=1 Tax=Phascolomyces articulosus TaxID=60185 RepID=A0AAD5JZ43_9FUNG|nr:hypothetical protein BDA99DRAFT_591785 [Phascolomyces articulosus]